MRLIGNTRHELSLRKRSFLSCHGISKQILELKGTVFYRRTKLKKNLANLTLKFNKYSLIPRIGNNIQCMCLVFQFENLPINFWSPNFLTTLPISLPRIDPRFHNDAAYSPADVCKSRLPSLKCSNWKSTFS